MASKLPKSVLKLFKDAGAKGGKARAEALTTERLTEIGLKGARARWGKQSEPKPAAKS